MTSTEFGSILLGGLIGGIVLITATCHPAKSESRQDETDHTRHLDTTVLAQPTYVYHRKQTNEVVTGYKVFEAGDCTVWRFQDSAGIHYLAEGRAAFSSGTGKSVSCSVSR